MGIGKQAYAQTLGESTALREHAIGMIPILEKQAASELDIRQKVFEQEIAQAKEMNLLAEKFDRQTAQQPVFVQAQAAEPAPEANYIPIIVLGILVILYLRKKG